MKKVLSEFKDKTVKELEKEELKMREEIGRLRHDYKVSMPKDTNMLSKRRKRLAVLLTVLAEKKKAS